MSVSLVLKRDPRLINKFPYDYYFSKYYDVLDKINKTFNKLISSNSNNFDTHKKTIYTLYDVIKIINKNFPLLITYGNKDKKFLNLIKTIYNKSFQWLEETLNWLEEKKVEEHIPDNSEQLIKQIRKFRIYYEAFRNEYFKDIVNKYHIDCHIVSYIDSYL
jgi:hypothetical protein